MLGDWSTTAIFFLVGVVTAILLYLLIISLRNPVLAKLGLRNMARRPAQTILIIVGLTLSTVIIIAALGTGDTLRYSVQRQAVAAYGQVDEIIAPPLLSMLTTLGNPNADTTQVDEARSTLNELMRGGLDSVLALVNGGLPSISMDRLESLRTEAAQEPLIDGVSGAVVFPTIIRNVATGQSEPIGFVFAVDDEYPEVFSLKSVDGRALTMQELEPGIGNIFLQAANLFAVIPQLTGQFSNLTSGLTAEQQARHRPGGRRCWPPSARSSPASTRRCCPICPLRWTPWTSWASTPRPSARWGGTPSPCASWRPSSSRSRPAGRSPRRWRWGPRRLSPTPRALGHVGQRGHRCRPGRRRAGDRHRLGALRRLQQLAAAPSTSTPSALNSIARWRPWASNCARATST